jgi:hypothetical protein
MMDIVWFNYEPHDAGTVSPQEDQRLHETGLPV